LEFRAKPLASVPETGYGLACGRAGKAGTRGLAVEASERFCVKKSFVFSEANTRRSSAVREVLLSLLFVTLTGLLPANGAQDETVVPTGANWLWRKGTNEVSAPINAWRTNGFPDTGWLTGPAPFHYGEGLTGGTTLSDMRNNYNCVFLRTRFLVTNVAEITAIRLLANFDDGFVAWINGIEIARTTNMAGMVPLYTNLATPAHEATGTETFTVTNPPASCLVAGTNMLAAQVFNTTRSSTDFRFDPSLQITKLVPDITPPTITSVAPAAGASIGALTQITVVFSESVTGVQAADLLIRGVPATGIVGASGTNRYTFFFPQPFPGAVNITWSAGHGITDLASLPFNATAPGATWSYTLVPPAVESVVPVPGTNVQTLTQITVAFNCPVIGVEAADFLVNDLPATSVLGGAGTNRYTFYFTQPLPGSVPISWDEIHGITDLTGVPFDALAPGATWSYTLADTVAPQASQLTPAAGAQVSRLTQVEVTFNEPVRGVDAADLRVNNQPASSVLGAEAGPYLFEFPQPANGTVQFAWATGHGITDAAPSPNAFAGGNWTVTLNTNLAPADIVINEFVAANLSGLLDEDGTPQDWIEIRNRGTASVNLLGWSLTDNRNVPGQWVFPSRVLAPGELLVVFASGKDRRAPTGANRYHTNFKLNNFGEYLALFNAESPRVAVSEFAPRYPDQRNNYSYGLDGTNAWRYFQTPSPGSANGYSTIVGIAPQPHFSVERGMFDLPFELQLSVALPGATIRYTTDGSDPTEWNGMDYVGKVLVTDTTCLRAAAFAPGYLPSRTRTQSYIFLDSVPNQSNNPPGFPTDWGARSGYGFPGDLVPADYEMDADPLRTDPNNPASDVDPVKLQRLKDGLRELPIVSIVMDNADMFGPAGMYYSPNVMSKTFPDKPCSVEMVLPDGTTGFTADCGITGHGNASRQPEKNPKHGFKLNFVGDFGETDLEYRLFPDSPATVFDDLILRPDFNSSWRHWSDVANNGSGAFQRTRASRTRDAWIKHAFRDMGQVASYNRYCHLFINGLYWGTYDFSDQPTKHFGANYFGGTAEDYDAYDQGILKAGTSTAYNSMLAIANLADNANYERMKQYLDVTEYVDYVLLHFFVGHQDWGNVKNWHALRRRTSGPDGTFKYFPWDGECQSLNEDVNKLASDGGSLGLPSGLFPKLDDNAQFRLDFADRVHKHMIAPGGALTRAANTNRWLFWQNLLDKPIVAEACRWGDYRRDVHPYSEGTYPLYTRESHWQPENNRMLSSYFVNRPAIVLNQFRSAGLYPAVEAPEFRETTTSGPIVGSSGVGAGYILAMRNPAGAGTIYYTTNGADPRVYYAGTVSGSALAYSAPLVLNTTVTLKARVLSAGTWSALNEATFTVGELGLPLRLTEINYNPIGGDAYEFVELRNTGALPLDAGGFSFQGINFVFPEGTVLAAGATVVLANNANLAAFMGRYPAVAVLGTFGGSLDNGGERLALLDRSGSTVTAVHYDDEGGWPKAADGGGYSLEIMDPRGDPNAPANWRASLQPNGTPGLPPTAASALGDIVLNEVLAENFSTITNGGTLPDWIEVRNRGAGATNLAGWSLSDDSNPRKFVFPANTPLAAGGYLVVWCDNVTNAPGLHTGFALNRSGDNVFLYDANTNRMDALTFGLQIADRSVGRISDAWQLNLPTPGSNNVAAALASVTNLALNEWLANPAAGGDDWLELFNRSATAPVSLQGLYVGTSNALGQLRALSFLAPRGYAQLLADEQAGAEHLEFKLAAAGDALKLYSDAAVLVDQVSYGAQAEAVSQGRLPDGNAALSTFSGSVSPGASNYVLSYFGPVLNEVLARNQRAVVSPWGNYADFIELFNPASTNVNLAGMALGQSVDDKDRWVFPAGVTINAGSYLRVWCDGGRAASSANGTAMNTGFALAGESGDVVLFNAVGQPVDWVSYGFQIQDLSIGRSGGTWQLLASPTPGAANDAPAALGSASDLRINEWLAAGAGDDWFELYNTGPLPVALGGLFLTDNPSTTGITNSPIAALSFIGGKDWVKVIADGNRSAGRDHANFALEQLGETLRLYAADRTLLDAVDFGVQTTNVSQGRLPDGAATLVSFPTTPTPGDANYLPLTNVVINEVLTHTDAPLEDAVELFNPTASELYIGGWYLSDSQSDLKRYRIPDGTSIPAGGYRVFYQGDFGPADGETDTPPLFTFNSAHGDAVYLSEADGGDNLTGYRIGQNFDASTNAVSFGRYATSVGVDFVALSRRTFGADNPATVAQFRAGTGAANAGPRVGPIVLNELMYHPAQGTNTAENPDEEFIELHNLTTASVPLRDPAHPTNAWRLASAVTFTFPTNTSIPAGGYLLVVPFDPVTNTAALAAFQARYGNNGTLVGPYAGRLNNAGDAVELWRPDAPQTAPHSDAGYVPYFLVDRVVYSDLAPWPVAADGGGASLQRLVATNYGNEPLNWKADQPTAGRTNSPAAGEPPIVLVPPQSRTNVVGTSAEFTVIVDGTAPLSYQWFFQGAPLAGRTGTNLVLNPVQAGDAGDYRVQITNTFGQILSQPATLTVWVPPSISVPPSNQTVNVGANASFSVLATGTAPLRYQWQRDGGHLAGRTDDLLNLGAVSPLDAGAYRVIVTNVAGAATSAVAVLTVQAPPVITLHPRGGFAAIGSRVTLSASATGDAPLSYQWRFNGAALVGATTNRLELDAAQTTHTGTYVLAVTNHAGWAESDPAVLTVLEAPALLTPGFTDEGELVSWLVGPTNYTYAIDATTNLADWFELGTLHHTNPVTPFLDPAAPASPTRFYRARLVE
jgi:hypothetical protein